MTIEELYQRALKHGVANKPIFVMVQTDEGRFACVPMTSITYLIDCVLLTDKKHDPTLMLEAHSPQ